MIDHDHHDHSGEKHVDLEQVRFVDGHIEQFTEFPYDELDRGNPLTAAIEGADAYTIAGDGLRAILAWCHRDGAAGLQSAFTRFVAVSCLIEPRWLDNETMEEIGARLGITKAAISKICVELQDTFKVKFRRTRPVDARRNMAASMRGNDNRRGKRGPTRKASVLP